MLAAAGLVLAATLSEVVTLSHGAAPVLARWVATPADGDAVAVAAVHMSVLNDDWNDSLRSQKFWTDRKTAKPSTSGGGATPVAKVSAAGSRNDDDDDDDDDQESADGSDWYDGDGNTYATLCVRLCDGSYTPVSFSTTRKHFKRDQKACQASCGSPARLFVYKTPGGSVEQMEDVDGEPYSKLKTAFLFRASYDESCKCKPHPWEVASLQRHRVYTLNDSARKGDRLASLELQAIKSGQPEVTSQRPETVTAERQVAQVIDVASANSGTQPIVFGPKQIRGGLPKVEPAAPLMASVVGSGFRAAQTLEPLQTASVPRVPVEVAATTPATVAVDPTELPARKSAASKTTRSARATRVEQHDDEDDAPPARKPTRSAKVASKSAPTIKVASSGGKGSKGGYMKLGAESKSIQKTYSSAVSTGTQNWRSAVFASRN